MQNAVRTVQTGTGVFRFIFGVHRKQDAQILMGFYIRLELGEHLPLCSLLPDFNTVRPVVADNAAPKRVVQITDQCLFILPID